jgi:hypothetical protein
VHVSDWLLLAQTIILLLTGVVVVCYAYETQRLRKASTTQADLIREQVATMRETLQLDIQEQIRASKPFIRWQGGSSGIGTWKREFQNEGGPISRISVHTMHELNASITPRDMLQTNQQGHVSFSSRTRGQQLLDPFTFEIRYRTRLDQNDAKQFIVEGGTPREVETGPK